MTISNKKSDAFTQKNTARQNVWDKLQKCKAARFPYPPHGRIPNYVGAKEAAERLMTHSLLRNSKCIKVNPDAPQRYVRELALKQGISVMVPTPRLRDGFKLFDPTKIPVSKYREAASLSKGAAWGNTVNLQNLPEIDLMVVGSVAVTENGRRCGKGSGYADIEYAILRELGQKSVPIFTTVHPLQFVNNFPSEPHDLPVSIIVTPDTLKEVANPLPSPSGINWDQLPPESMHDMPILRTLQLFKKSKQLLNK